MPATMIEVMQKLNVYFLKFLVLVKNCTIMFIAISDENRKPRSFIEAIHINIIIMRKRLLSTIFLFITGYTSLLAGFFLISLNR